MDTRWNARKQGSQPTGAPTPAQPESERRTAAVTLDGHPLRNGPVTTPAPDALLLGHAEDRPITLPLKFGNRHGLIAGATGTGKTVSVLRLVEGFAKAGVPVVIADVKGDVAGLGMPGAMNPKLQARLEALKLADFAFAALPVAFWDLFGTNGHPLRTTVSEIGPTLLSRILELSDAQSGVLDIAFALADAEGLLLLDMDDLRALLGFIGENRDAVSKAYGLVSPQSIAALQRALLKFEQEGREVCSASRPCNSAT